MALVTAACGGGDDGGDGAPAATSEASQVTTTTVQAPVAGGEATILMTSEIVTLDPVKMTGSGGSDAQRAFALYGALLVTDPETHEARPLMAESFEPNADFTVWTLKIKPGITMSDGTPYDAAAVKANWDRAKDLANRSPSIPMLLAASAITVVDATTLTVALTAPNAHFDKAVSRVGINYIASAKALADNVDLTSQAVGAGPFVLKEWLRDDHMILTKNPTWNGGEGPYLDTLTFRVISDEDQRIDTFVTGGADAFYTSTPASVTRAQDEVSDASYQSVKVMTGQAILFNMTKPPFDDVRMRTAVAQGVDWQALTENVFGEGSNAATNFTLEGTPWYDPNATLPPYDTAAAQSLIDAYVADHGGDPVQLSFTAFQQSLAVATAEFIQTSLSQLDNIEVEVQVGDAPTNIQRILGLDYMMSSWGFPVLDPDPGLYVSVHSASVSNRAKYNNPQVDALLDQARVLTDQAERKPLYDQVHEILAKDLPYYPFVDTINGFVSTADLKDVAVVNDGIMRFDLIWKAPA